MASARETRSSKRSGRSAAATASPPFARQSTDQKPDIRARFGEGGARETPSSQRSGRSPAATASPASAHHSSKQKRDTRGRFARQSTTTPARQSTTTPARQSTTTPARQSTTTTARQSTTTPARQRPNVRVSLTRAEQAARSMPGIPDIPPGFTEAHRHVNRGKAAAQPSSSSISEPKIHDHRYVFLVNPKITIHCSFSHESDDETGTCPSPMKREIKKQAERLRVLVKRKYFKEPISLLSDDDDDSDY